MIQQRKFGDLGEHPSVFSQYAVVVPGLLIALRTIGIDLTALAIFAGALGIGMGLGLQTIANNFVSGLLLPERPLRTGDIVNIANNEGEVTHIGMRSVTVTTWDNQEVIIPNAEVATNAFTNWTHSDNVVRTRLTIGVSFHSDPHRALEVISAVVKRNPAVLDIPEPRVWLQEFADSSINFQVQYFYDVKRYNRLEVRSQILFGIWDTLKQAGVHIPFPQRDIHVKQLPYPPPATQGSTTD